VDDTFNTVNEMTSWKPLDTARAASLSDARRQLHHAAQLATAFGISFLEKKPDDSHTNLEWMESDGALASNALNGTRVRLRVSDLTLMLGDASCSMLGRTLDDAVDWLTRELRGAGFDASQFTTSRHYEIPHHEVDDGEPFTASLDDLEQLSRWYSNGARVFNDVKSANENAADVRCWPHHFDIATLLSFSGGKSVGVGLEPGDGYYDEPYFYLNMYPSPQANALPDSLDGGGQWHTREWIGAVLPASAITSNALEQEAQVRSFIKSAIDTNTKLIGAS
jgi:hypothetical protein